MNPSDKIPSRFSKSAPVEGHPAGAGSFTPIKSQIDPHEKEPDQGLPLITVRFPNGSAFTYQADRFIDGSDSFSLTFNNELVAIVSKAGCVLEIVSPYAVELQTEVFPKPTPEEIDHAIKVIESRNGKPQSVGVEDGLSDQEIDKVFDKAVAGLYEEKIDASPANIGPVFQTNKIGFFRAFVLFLRMYFARPEIKRGPVYPTWPRR